MILIMNILIIENDQSKLLLFPFLPEVGLNSNSNNDNDND